MTEQNSRVDIELLGIFNVSDHGGRKRVIIPAKIYREWGNPEKVVLFSIGKGLALLVMPADTIKLDVKLSASGEE